MTIQEKLFRLAFKNSKKYFRQKSEEILYLLSDYEIEQYAVSELDLIDKDYAEDHCNCTSLYDCSDDELKEEYEDRKLSPQTNNIIQEDIMNRFQYLLNTLPPDEVLEMIEQKETKHLIFR